MQIRMTVASGHGWASKYCDEEVAALSSMEGVQFVDGSLNLVGSAPVWLNAESATYRNGGRVFWRATLGNTPVMVERWLSGCPAHIFEIFAAVQLRDTLNLEDGDTVNLEIPDEVVAFQEASLRNRLIWNLFWKYREYQIYRDGLYMSLMRNRLVRGYTWRSMQKG